MKNTLKVIALLLALVTVMSCFFGCGIEKPALGSDELSTDGSDVLATGGDTENSATEKNKNTASSNKNNNGEKLIVTATPEGGKEVMVKSDSTLTPLTLSASSVANYEIVSHYVLTHSAIVNFMSNLKSKTGVDFKATTRSQVDAIGGKQIVISSFSAYSSIKGAPEFKSWTGGAVSVVGETIYICVAETALLDSVLTSFVSKIKSAGSNKYVVAADLKYAYDKCAVSEYIPPLSATSVTDKGVYSAGGGNYQKTYKDVKAADVSRYCQTLISKGFTLQQQNTINGNCFYLYVKGDTMVHINWFSKLNQFSIVYGPKTYIPAKKPITGYTKRATPTITMLALGEIGTSIVIQLEDGSFLLIDGGQGKTDYYPKDSATLWNFLSSHAPAGEKPRITWLVTHIHMDHRNLFQQFIPAYKNKIDLELVVWNMPDFNEIGEKYAPNWKEGETKPAKNYATPVATLIDIINKNFPKTPIYTCHSGEKLYLPGCEVEFLVCHEDYYLNNFQWVNDTSLTCRININGKSMMVFGDTTKYVSNAIITPAYGNYIKSDILQLAHHGNGEGTLATYKAVDPDICLWSSIKDRFDALKKTGDANIWLYASSGNDGQRARSHYHHSNTTTITIPSMSVSQTTVY
jgi:hypothetical protein